MLKKFRKVDTSTKLKRTNIFVMKIILPFYNARLRVSDSRTESKQIRDIAPSLGRCPTMISSFITETAYLSLKLVGSLHK